MTGVTDPISHAGVSPDRNAWLVAEDAARAAGVDIRTLDDLADLESIRRLYERIWRTGESNPPVTADLLKAMAKAGSYISGAFEDGELVGACFGFFSEPARESLHSHIAGVLDRMQGRHVGFALKLHQRAWSMSRGVHEIAWTFDPLIRRNAHFNLTKLAATATEYLPDFYGAMDDDINRSDPSDRLLVTWALDSPEVLRVCNRTETPTPRLRPADQVALQVSASGGPLLGPAAGPTVLVGVPADIESLRDVDPACAAEWRLALREVLGGLLSLGARVRAFDRTGWYVVDTGEQA